MKGHVDCSLIICTYRRPEPLGRLLAALAEQTVALRQILVIDGSDDEASARVVAQAPAALGEMGLDYVRVDPADRGLTRQRNVGIDRARGRYIAFLDDDTVPRPTYFEAIIGVLEQREEVIGVGGYCLDVPWHRDTPAPRGAYRVGAWWREEGLRWRLRRVLGLAGSAPPGWMPPSGHGRPIAFLPPDGRVVEVEFFMGAASCWRRELFEKERFEPRFVGYGLYEDLEFCLRAGRQGTLVVHTGAQTEHHHAPSGRPNAFRYGRMVVENGWWVWRQRWPRPSPGNRLRWWATSLLLSLLRFRTVVTGPARTDALRDMAGRWYGLVKVLLTARPRGGS